MPAEDGLRRDEERTPALARHETREKRYDGAVGPGEAGTSDLAAKHGELVSQYEDLGILRRGI